MVNLSDDIQITADADQAIAELQAFRRAAQQAFDGQDAKAYEKSMASVERAIAKVAAAQRAAAGEAQKQVRAQKELESLGLKQNSSGQIINAKTGRFAGGEELAYAKERLTYLDQLGSKEAGLERMRAINAQNTYAREQKAIAGTHQFYAEQLKQQDTWNNLAGRLPFQLDKARVAQQAMYDQMFKATDRNPFAKLAASMTDIPPARAIAGVKNFTKGLEDLGPAARYAFQDVSRSATVAGLAISGVGIAAIGFAMAHERAFANVARTTQTSTAGYAVLQRQIEKMSMELPVSFEELTNIAAAAGQLGIQASGVENFTRTVAMLSATTNLTADAAGIALARFKTFFAEAPKDAEAGFAVTEATFSNLASSILKVGVNSIATESGIVNISTQISSMGSYAGFTADQVIGLSGALASVGVAPELSRGITTRLFTVMGDAVSEGGLRLEKFAQLAGVSSEKFKTSWGTGNMAPIFVSMMKGLGEMQEKSQDANQALRDLGITGSRDRPVWLRLASAADEAGTKTMLLTQTMNDARDGWLQNIELQMQYSKISKTTSARMQVLGQAFEQLFATMGKQSNSALGDVAEGLTDVIRGLEEFMNSGFGQALGTFATGFSLVAGGVLLVIGAIAGLMASIQGMGQAFNILTAQGTTAFAKIGAAAKLVTATAGILGLIATVATLIGTFVAMGAESEKAARGIQDFDSIISAMQLDAQSGKEYGNAIKFTGEQLAIADKEGQKNVKTSAKVTEALTGVKESAYLSANGIKESADALLIWGDNADAAARQQLMTSENFRNLFSLDKVGLVDMNLGYKNQLKDIGFDASDLNWDKLLAEIGKDGGDVRKEFDRQIEQMFGSVALDASIMGGTASAFRFFGDELETVLGGTEKSLSGAIAAWAALNTQSNHTAAEMLDDAELIDEASQKIVDSMSAGFKKFADPKGLIGLTQKMLDVSDDAERSLEERQAETAAAYEEAWASAYGGAKFSLNDYLTNFRRGADEQMSFFGNLTLLSNDGRLGEGIIADLAAMGPEAVPLVQALVDDMNSAAGAGLEEFADLWGETGLDASVQMATQLAIGTELAAAVMKEGGVKALREFNTALAAGTPVADALKLWGLDENGDPLDIPVTVSVVPPQNPDMPVFPVDPVKVPLHPEVAAQPWADALTGAQEGANGNPIILPVKPKQDEPATLAAILGAHAAAMASPAELLIKSEKDDLSLGAAIGAIQNATAITSASLPVKAKGDLSGIWQIIRDTQATLNNNPVWVPVKTSVSGSGNSYLDANGFASGGYTGPGGKYAPAGIVHRGEFVFDQKSTSAIGIGTLYSLMRQARGARSVTRGYANGGAVGGGSGIVGSNVVALTPGTIQQIALAVRPQLVVDGEVLGRAVSNNNRKSAMRGEY